jgi:hypothetical protein
LIPSEKAEKHPSGPEQAAEKGLMIVTAQRRGWD